VLEGIDVFVGGLGMVGVMVTVAVGVLVLLTVEQPTRKMKVDKMMRRIGRSKNLRICSSDMRIILKEPGYEITNTNQTHRYQYIVNQLAFLVFKPPLPSGLARM
jgi:hypothetical protein